MLQKIRRLAPAQNEDEEALKRLSRGSAKLSAGSIVSECRDSPDQIFVMESGWAVSYIVTKAGRRQIIDFLLPGDWVWPGVYCSNGVAVVACLTEAVVWRFRAGDWINHLRTNERLHIGLCVGTVLNHLLLIDRVVALGCRSGRERILYLFWELIRRQEFVGLGRQPPVLPLSRSVIGDALGMTDRHVSRVVKWAEEEGLIRAQRQRIEVIDRARLHEAVGGDAFSIGLMDQLASGAQARDLIMLPESCGICGVCGGLPGGPRN